MLDVWKVTIDGWLEADREAPRKQRHTARRVWQRLVDEHHAQVGESTVRRYVAEARRRLPAVLAEVKVPQTHPLGAEAEVDFGRVSFFLAGVPVDGWMFVLRLSASGRGFHRVSLNQAQQVFLDGHVRAFEHMGGVPGRIRYDNLKPAVVRVLKGRDRAESERFIALRSHGVEDAFTAPPGHHGGVPAFTIEFGVVIAGVTIGELFPVVDRPSRVVEPWCLARVDQHGFGLSKGGVTPRPVTAGDKINMGTGDLTGRVGFGCGWHCFECPGAMDQTGGVGRAHPGFPGQTDSRRF